MSSGALEGEGSRGQGLLAAAGRTRHRDGALMAPARSMLKIRKRSLRADPHT